jgi:hypothetical protein
MHNLCHLCYFTFTTGTSRGTHAAWYCLYLSAQDSFWSRDSRVACNIVVRFVRADLRGTNGSLIVLI